MSGLSILNHKNNNIILMVIIIALSANNRASVYERLSIIKIPPMPFPWLQAPYLSITVNSEHPEWVRTVGICVMGEAKEKAYERSEFIVAFEHSQNFEKFAPRNEWNEFQ